MVVSQPVELVKTAGQCHTQAILLLHVVISDYPASRAGDFLFAQTFGRDALNLLRVQGLYLRGGLPASPAVDDKDAGIESRLLVGADKVGQSALVPNGDGEIGREPAHRRLQQFKRILAGIEEGDAGKSGQHNRLLMWLFENGANGKDGAALSLFWRRVCTAGRRGKEPVSDFNGLRLRDVAENRYDEVPGNGELRVLLSNLVSGQGLDAIGCSQRVPLVRVFRENC